MANVICIEDEKVFRENLAEILISEGYRVKAFGDGANALDYLSTLKGEPPEIIICDVNLPQVSGYEFIRRLRIINNAAAHTPVIFLSAMGQKQDVLKGLSLNAVDYLVKPVDFDELLGKLKEHIRRC